MTIEKQPLYVLSRSGQQSFCVYSLERPEPESSHPMPALGFCEERLDPHLPLAHGLLASLGLVVVPDSLKVVLIEAATKEATAVAVGAFALQRAARCIPRRRPGTWLPSLCRSCRCGAVLRRWGRRRGFFPHRSGSPSLRRSWSCCGSSLLPA